MPTTIRIIHAHDFIKATPEGRLDLDSSRALLLEIESAAVPLGEHAIVLDTRRTRSELSVTDLWYLVAELGSLPADYARRTAVLCPLEQFDHAGFFALCARNRGFRIRAFTSYEEAIEWLIGDEDPGA